MPHGDMEGQSKNSHGLEQAYNGFHRHFEVASEKIYGVFRNIMRQYDGSQALVIRYKSSWIPLGTLRRKIWLDL